MVRGLSQSLQSACRLHSNSRLPPPVPVQTHARILGAGGMSRFQVKLGREWSDYSKNEDKKLKTAYMSGQRTARFNMFINGKKEKYEVNFSKMTQENLVSGGSREIRPPHRMKAPSSSGTLALLQDPSPSKNTWLQGAPIRDADDKPLEPGPTICIKVPEGAAGSVIQVPHPKVKGQFFEVRVPEGARAGQPMLVPVPAVTGVAPAPPAPAGGTDPTPVPSAPPAPAAGGEPAKKGWSTGAKVAAGVGGVAAVGGLAVAGALLAEGDGLEDLGETVADIATDVGDAVGDVATDVGEWIGGAAEVGGEMGMWATLLWTCSRGCSRLLFPFKYNDGLATRGLPFSSVLTKLRAGAQEDTPAQGDSHRSTSRMSHFQVKLGHHWQDYGKNEDKKLKTAYMSGQRTARFNMFINGKKEKYEVNFKDMTQENLVSGGSREIRAPYRMEAPSHSATLQGGPIRDANDKPMEPGPTICIKVPEGAAGTIIQVPHPKAKGQFFEVKVPAGARAGQPMLVPVPSWEGRMDPVREQFRKWDKDGKGFISFAELAELIVQLNPALTKAEINDLIMSTDKNSDYQISYDEFASFLEGSPGKKPAPAPAGGGTDPAPADPAAPAAPGADPAAKPKGWSTGAKVAAGVGGVAAVAGVAGLCVAGALLADGDGLEGLGDAVGDIATDAGEWIGGAAEDVGDFVMDLF
eukprot:s23_g16.t3